MRVSSSRQYLCTVLLAWTTVAALPCQGSDVPATVIWIAMPSHISLKKTPPGTLLEGKLARGVYWRESEVFPKGTAVRLEVAGIERQRRSAQADDRPFLIHAFAPRHELGAKFRSVTVIVPGGPPVPLQATFMALSQRAEITAPTRKHLAGAGNPAAGEGGRPTPARPGKASSPWVLTLQVEPIGTTFSALAAARTGREAGAAVACPEPCRIADGTRMPVMLLEGLSAGKDRQGQSFQAMILEPVMAGSRMVIPQGSIVQGVLAGRVPPRRLYRPGSLSLSFKRVALPNGTAFTIAASPAAAEVDRGTHMQMDSEGRIHAPSPGKARFLLDFAVTGGISKVCDDTTQLIIEAISSTATDASTAGVAKIAAAGATAIYMLTRHGRDVILPAYTEMDISLSRATSLTMDSPATKPPN